MGVRALALSVFVVLGLGQAVSEQFQVFRQLNGVEQGQVASKSIILGLLVAFIQLELGFNEGGGLFLGHAKLFNPLGDDVGVQDLVAGGALGGVDIDEALDHLA